VRVTVNGPLGTCDAFTKATGRLKEWSMVNGNKGMMNIGTRPTFGEHQQTLEVHILDFKGDLYDKEVKVEFIERLRDEQRFESKEELTDQLLKDEMRIKNLKI
jgi:riboflavin kinase/FMN adenylyltransferase